MENHLSPINPSELDDRVTIFLQTLEATNKDLAACTTAADALIAETEENDEDLSRN